MSQEGFDPHLNLAQFAGAVTQEEIDLYNEGKLPKLKDVRKKYKAANYSCVYGVGAAKLARETGMKQKEAKALIEAYWERNWAIKKVADKAVVKEFGGQRWLFNPVSGFWYSLRYDKDKWSTTNQGTGVYIFDSWLARCSLYGYMGNAQFHDETLGFTKDQQQTTEVLQKGIDKLNEDLNLNVTMAIDIQYGKHYASVH